MNITRSVHEKWKQLSAEHAEFRSGYSVFYSPLSMNPKLMVIGFNPGGGSESFDAASAQEIPTKHDYFVYDYPLARKMKKIFTDINKLDLLESSVKTNLVFFRTRSMDDWSKIDPRLRKDLERFCLDKNLEIIRYLQPEIILAEGIETYLTIKRALSISEEDVTDSKGRSLIIKAKTNSPRLLGIIHPSGAHVSNEDWSLIRERLLSELR